MTPPAAYISVAMDEGASGVTMSSASQVRAVSARAGAITRPF